MPTIQVYWYEGRTQEQKNDRTPNHLHCIYRFPSGECQTKEQGMRIMDF